jgi:hypothetical protein
MLIRKIETFIHRTKIPPTRFGRLAVGDPRLVFDLRHGRIPGPRLEQRVEHFMNNYREDSHAR